MTRYQASLPFVGEANVALPWNLSSPHQHCPGELSPPSPTYQVSCLTLTVLTLTGEKTGVHGRTHTVFSGVAYPMEP